MTDEDKIKAVTTVLTGEFYVGQQVVVDDPGYVEAYWQGGKGVVKRVSEPAYGPRVDVDMGELSDGETVCFEARSLKPL